MGLTELPESVGKLVRLKFLKLGHSRTEGGEQNQLTMLPSELWNNLRPPYLSAPLRLCVKHNS